MKVHSAHDLRIGTADPGPQILADLCYQKIPMRSSSTVSCFCEALSHHAILVRTKVCIDAAMQYITITGTYIRRNKTWKRPLQGQWKLSSLMTHDFLLAAMLISLYLSNTAVDSSSSPAASPNQLPIIWTRDELLRSLKDSQKISEEASSSSRDAAKVARALKVLLSTLGVSGRLSSTSSAQWPPGMAPAPNTSCSSPSGGPLAAP